MKNIILIGMKGCGKTTVGRVLARKLSMRFVDLDHELSVIHEKDTGKRCSCRKIFQSIGETEFRILETKALKSVNGLQHIVLSCGGGAPLCEINQQILTSLGTVIFLDTDEDILLDRMLKHGTPAFLEITKDKAQSLHQILEERSPAYEKIARIRLVLRDEAPAEITKHIRERIGL